MPAPSVRRKPRAAGRARSPCPPCPSTSCAAGGFNKAEELLKLGVRADDSWHIVTQTDGAPLQPRSLTHVVSAFPERVGNDPARPTAQPRQPHAGVEYPPQDRAGT